MYIDTIIYYNWSGETNIVIKPKLIVPFDFLPKSGKFGGVKSAHELNISLAQVIVFLCILISTQIETREDEEQNVKMAETIELLLAAGYFRARIKGLSPFDKVLRWLRKNFAVRESNIIVG